MNIMFEYHNIMDCIKENKYLIDKNDIIDLLKNQIN
jgi:hypothetical protein